MKIPSNTLELRNIDQLISVDTENGTTMGTLERVKFLNDGTVSVRISGDTLVLGGDHEVCIRRSTAVSAIVKTSYLLEEFLDEDTADDCEVRAELEVA